MFLRRRSPKARHLAAALTVCAVLSAALSATTSNATALSSNVTALSPTTERAAVPPRPESLGIVTRGPGNRPLVALTFDADMTPGMEGELKDGKVKSFDNVAVREILEREHAPATFFLTGMWAEEYPAVARELAQNPLFEIEDHSYSHPGFAQPCYGLPDVPGGQNAAAKDQEYTRSQAAIFKATGVTPKYFRFPGGCARADDVAQAEQHNLKVVHWDVISGDAEGLPGPAIVSTVLREAKNGSIVVMHSHGGKAAHTADALEAVIVGLRARGFTLVKVQDLLAQEGTPTTAHLSSGYLSGAHLTPAPPSSGHPAATSAAPSLPAAHRP